MFSGITEAEAKDKPRIEIPCPKLRLDRVGNAVIKDGRLQFDVKAEKIDFEITKNSPFKERFSDRFIVGATHRAKPLELAVIFYLAKTTEWSVVHIVLNENNEPLLTPEGRGVAVVKTYGNRSATRTISEIASAVSASYGAVQKALAVWEAKGVIRRISEYKKNGKGANEESGRPVEHRRYEFNPAYVWNGHIWMGNGYEASLSLEAFKSIGIPAPA